MSASAIARAALSPLLATLGLVSGCGKDPPPNAHAGAASASVALARTSGSAPAGTPSASAFPTPLASAEPVKRPSYPWLDDASAGAPKATDSLDVRFPPPKEHARVSLAPGSFGAFLRALPLAAPDTPVSSFAGGVIHPATHENVAAVVAIDVGKHDLQQCADTVIRLHAEWQWGLGRRALVYRAASGMELSLDRYLAGDRLHFEGGKLGFERIAKKSDPTHPSLRGWLDEVFGWANTGSLSKEGTPVALADLAPGDFFVMPGVPFGHAVVVLDLSRAKDGRRAVLLGQGFMPAQSLHVLRPKGAPATSEGAWFVIDEASGKMATPFWEPFPFSTLRRLPS